MYSKIALKLRRPTFWRPTKYNTVIIWSKFHASANSKFYHKPINDNLDVSSKGNYKRNTYYNNSKTYKSIKNREDTKKRLPANLTTFTVSYTLSKVWQNCTSWTKKIVRFFVQILSSVNFLFRRKYAMCVARV